MELRHLRYFVAVAEVLNFHRAAEALAMAQPPLSLQIQQLERELGVTLLDRTARKIQLTDAGRVFLRDATAILAQAEAATQRAKRAERGEVGQLTIGYTSLILSPLFPHILRRYRAEYPEVEVYLRDLVTLEQMQHIQANTIDVSFATHASVSLTEAEHEALTYEVILREPLVALLPKTHPLADRERIPLQAIADEPWIWFARPYDPTTFDYMMHLFTTMGIRPQVVQFVNSAQMIFGLVLAGFGVSLIPASVERIAQDALVYVELEAPQPQVEFDLVWRKQPTSPVVEAFLRVAREIAYR